MRIVIFKRDTKSGISDELGYYDSDSDQWSDDSIPMLINEMFGRSVLPSELSDLLMGGRMWATNVDGEFKHLPGRHSQSSHGRGGERRLYQATSNLPVELQGKSQNIIDRKIEAAQQLAPLYENVKTLTTQLEDLEIKGTSKEEMKNVQREINGAEKNITTIERQYYKDTSQDRNALYKHYEIEGQRKIIEVSKAMPEYDRKIKAKQEQARATSNNTQAMKLLNEAEDVRDSRSAKMTEIMSEGQRSALPMGKARNRNPFGELETLDDELEGIVNGFKNRVETMIPDHAMPLRPVQISLNERNGRAAYGGGVMRLSPFSSSTDYIHEFGHHFEESSSSAKSRIGRIYRGRTKGEEAISMQALSPGRGYHKTEMSKPDRFIDPYMGIQHTKGRTELISTGLEAIMADPLKFSRDDPDLFRQVYAILKSG